MLKSNNFQHYKLSTLSFLNIKIPSFSFLKKAILGLYKNLFWHISRKIGKILENFQKVPFKALLKQQKIFSKSLMKMDRFPKKKIFYWKIKLSQFLAFSVIYTPDITPHDRIAPWLLLLYIRTGKSSRSISRLSNNFIIFFPPFIIQC